MAKHTVKTWYLIADGSRARLFSSSSLTMQKDYVNSHLHKHGDSDQSPGSVSGGTTSVHHAYEPRTDWHHYPKKVFAKELIDILKKAYDDHEFNELILIAPPETLGDLRQELKKNSLDHKVTAELAKDFTHFSVQELQDHLPKALAL